MKYLSQQEIEAIDKQKQGELLHVIGNDQWAAIREVLVYANNMHGDKFRAPNLANATTMHLVDEIAEVRAEIKPRQTYEKLLKGVLDTRRGDANFLDGEKYIITYKWISKMIPDQDKLKTHFGDAWNDYCKPSEYWEGRTIEK